MPRVSDQTKTTPPRTSTAGDAELTVQKALRGLDGKTPQQQDAAMNAAMPAIKNEMAGRGVSPARADAAERSLRSYGEAKKAMDQNRWGDAQRSIADSERALAESEHALPSRAENDLAGRIEGSKDLIAGRLEAEGPQSPRVPMERDTFERDTLERVPLKRDPLERDPLERDPLERDPRADEVELTLGASDALSPFAKSAQGYERLANRKIYAEIPETSGSLLGKPLALHLPGKTIDHPPSAEDIFHASLEQLGPGAVSANARYRQETGRNIGYVEITDAQIRGAWNADSKQFDISPAPSQALVRTINAYNRGGVEGADLERQKILEEDAATAKRVQAVREAPRTWQDTIEAGVAQGGIAGNQILHNISSLTLAAGTDAVYGTNSPEWRAGMRWDRQNQLALAGAANALPEERSMDREIARGVVAGLTQAPTYIAASRAGGMYGPVMVGYVGNLHRGQGEAIVNGMSMAGTMGSMQFANGFAAQWKSQVARNLFARGAGGTTNAASNFIAGDHSASGFAKNFMIGGLSPVGKLSEPDGIAPRRFFDFGEQRAPPTARGPRTPGTFDEPVVSQARAAAENGSLGREVSVPETLVQKLPGWTARNNATYGRAMGEVVADMQGKMSRGELPDMNSAMDYLSQKTNEVNTAIARDDIAGGQSFADFGRPREALARTPMGDKYSAYRDPAMASVAADTETGGILHRVVEDGIELTTAWKSPWGDIWMHAPPESFPAIKGKMNEAYQRALNAKTKPELIDSVAELHWWGAHMVPFHRGSAGAIDAMTKSLLINGGVAPGAWKEGVGVDLEAFQLPREEFVRRYPSFFEP